MKKLLVIAITLVLVIGLSGCGSSKTDVTKDSTKQSTVSVTQQKINIEKRFEKKYPFPKVSKEVGNGKIVIVTQNGTSENGNVPVELVKNNATNDSIILKTSNLQEDKRLFQYVDNSFNTYTAHIDKLPFSINLKNGNLKPGIHTITIVQYENNDLKGKVVEFHQAKYEIKEK